MKATTRKIFALLLCAALFASLFTVQAFAAQEGAAGQEGTFSLYSKERDQYFDALGASLSAVGQSQAEPLAEDPYLEYLRAYGRALLVYRLGVEAYYDYLHQYEDLRDEWYTTLQAERAALEAVWYLGAAKRDADMRAAFDQAKQIEDEAKAAYDRGEITRAEYFRRVSEDKDAVLADAVEDKENTETLMETAIDTYKDVSEATGDYYSELIKELNNEFQALDEEALLRRLQGYGVG